jgi:soluble lytic murein transglycosylase-like protein
MPHRDCIPQPGALPTAGPVAATLATILVVPFSACGAEPAAAGAVWCAGLDADARSKFAEAASLCSGIAPAAPEPIPAPTVPAALPGGQRLASPIASIAVQFPAPANGRLLVGAGDPLLDGVARQFAIDPLLLRAIVAQESGGQRHAVSAKGAIGLMQVMPATARGLGIADPAALHDPRTSLEAGATVLKRLQRQFGSNLALTLAAYNAGPGAVERWRGIPPYRETRRYVTRILARYRRSRAAAGSGAGA